MDYKNSDPYRTNPKPFEPRTAPDGGLYQSPTFQKVVEGSHLPKGSSLKSDPPKKFEMNFDIARMIKEDEEEKARLQQTVKAQVFSKPPTTQKQASPGVHKTLGKLLCNAAGNREDSSNHQRTGSGFEPDFEKGLLDMCKPLGEPLVMEVRLSKCTPAPSVHWYHNNKPKHESEKDDVRILSTGFVNTLVLGELTQEQLGRYTCTIMNKHGSKSTKCTITADLDGTPKSSPRPAFMTSRPPSFKNNYNNAYQAAPSLNSSKRSFMPSSTNMDLYSNKNVEKAYHNQVVKPAQREAMQEESEVMKALRLSDSSAPAPSVSVHKSRTMRFLEQQLQNEQQDLPESEDL